jgi:hypothetical protein
MRGGEAQWHNGVPRRMSRLGVINGRDRQRGERQGETEEGREESVVAAITGCREGGGTRLQF